MVLIVRRWCALCAEAEDAKQLLILEVPGLFEGQSPDFWADIIVAITDLDDRTARTYAKFITSNKDALKAVLMKEKARAAGEHVAC